MELMPLGIDRVGLGDLSRAQPTDLTHQLHAIPLGFPLGLGRFVLDLLSVWRQSRRASIRSGDDDHRLGFHDNQVNGWIHDVAHRVAHPRRLLGIGSDAALAATPKASAATSPKPTAAAPPPAATSTV